MRWMLLLLLLTTGCSHSLSPNLLLGVNQITQQTKVRDAKLRRSTRHPGLRVDAMLEQDLDRALSSEDINEIHMIGAQVFDGAHHRTKESVNDELDRLPADAWTRLFETYSIADQSELRKKVLHAETTQIKQLKQQLLMADSVADATALLNDVKRGIEPSVAEQGRLARSLPFALFSLPSALLVASIHQKEWHGRMDDQFGLVTRYDLGTATVSGSSKANQLLAKHAPILIQQVNPDAHYGSNVNKIGSARALDSEHMIIDTAEASVYAYARHVHIQNAMQWQLTYTFWYPEHPSLHGENDPEAGHIEGMTVRLTLDRDEKPAIFETLYACGCHHRVYPTTEIEQRAQQTHGGVERGKTYSIEKRIAGKIDLIVPDNVTYVQGSRPVVRVAAGWHGIVGISYEPSRDTEKLYEQQKYTLRPYHDLEHMAADDGSITSLFHENGLVRGAQRREGVFFTPIGILSAGQPRQRGTQLIHWDQYAFDDPTLLEKALRLPSGF